MKAPNRNLYFGLHMNKYLMKAQNPYCISAFIYTEGPILSWPLYALKAQIAHLLWPSRAAQADSGLLRHHYGPDSARIGPKQVCYLGEQIQIVSRPSHTLNCWMSNFILLGPSYAMKFQMYLSLHKQWSPQLYFGLYMHLRSQLYLSLHMNMQHSTEAQNPNYISAFMYTEGPILSHQSLHMHWRPNCTLYLGLHIHWRPNCISAFI